MENKSWASKLLWCKTNKILQESSKCSVLYKPTDCSFSLYKDWSSFDTHVVARHHSGYTDVGKLALRNIAITIEPFCQVCLEKMFQISECFCTRRWDCMFLLSAFFQKPKGSM